jgi:hypothetical protein
MIEFSAIPQMRKRFPEFRSTQIITELAAQWKLLSEPEKVPYLVKAQTLKKKYDEDKAKWVAESAGRRPAGPPKRPSSGYILFSEEKVAEVRLLCEFVLDAV